MLLHQIRQWFQQNDVYIKFLLLLSIAAGVTTVCLSFSLPGFFSAITSITPLAFLATMNFPLALLALSAISIGAVFVATICGTLLTKQLITIGEHIWALFFNPDADLISSGDSTNYIQKYLRDKSGPHKYSEEIEIAEILNTHHSNEPVSNIKNEAPASVVEYDEKEITHFISMKI